jgi:hypothetical protein
MTLSSTLGSFAVGGPLWLGIVLAIGATASIAAYLISYFYLMIRSPDSLRSETFTLKKLAIEKGIYGDSFVGSLEIDSAGSPKLLGPSSVQSQPGNEP